MKKRVDMSTWSFLLTTIIIVFLTGMFVWLYVDAETRVLSFVTLGLLALMLIPSLIWMPLCVELKGGSLLVRRPLKVKEIALADIEEVRQMPPTMGAIRLCGSGGFMGYWGWFREGDIGKYFAYYGRSSDAFLVTLCDGSKYMLGCRDAGEMVAAIAAGIEKQQ
ncbi:MAG: PH domain-containing protein [Lepagella sp.]